MKRHMNHILMISLVIASFFLRAVDTPPEMSQLPPEIQKIILKEAYDSASKDFLTALESNNFDEVIQNLKTNISIILADKNFKQYIYPAPVKMMVDFLSKKFNTPASTIIYSLNTPWSQQWLKNHKYSLELIFREATRDNYFSTNPTYPAHDSKTPFISSKTFKTLAQSLSDDVIFNKTNLAAWEKDDISNKKAMTQPMGIGSKWAINQKILERFVIFIMVTDFVPPALTPENFCKYSGIYRYFYINNGYTRRDFPFVEATVYQIARALAFNESELATIVQKVLSVFNQMSTQYKDYIKKSKAYSIYLQLGNDPLDKIDEPQDNIFLVPRDPYNERLNLTRKIRDIEYHYKLSPSCN